MYKKLDLILTHCHTYVSTLELLKIPCVWIDMIKIRDFA